jgi:hypothetical protein
MRNISVAAEHEQYLQDSVGVAPQAEMLCGIDPVSFYIFLHPKPVYPWEDKPASLCLALIFSYQEIFCIGCERRCR